MLQNGLQKLMQKLIALKPTPRKGIANKKLIAEKPTPK
jgi:hypothetical protein